MFSVAPRLFVAAAILSWCLGGTHGYPYGAGACYPGGPSVGGPHLQGNPKTGTLGQGKFSVKIGNSGAFAPGATVYLDLGKSYTVTLAGLGVFRTFKGHLIRLGGTDPAALQPGVNSVVAQECTNAGVSGATHNDDDGKNTATAILHFTQNATNIPLDVTVVVSVEDGRSEYYYGGFTINAVQGGGPPTQAPTPGPPKPVRGVLCKLLGLFC